MSDRGNTVRLRTTATVAALALAAGGCSYGTNDAGSRDCSDFAAEQINDTLDAIGPLDAYQQARLDALIERKIREGRAR